MSVLAWDRRFSKMALLLHTLWCWSVCFKGRMPFLTPTLPLRRETNAYRKCVELEILHIQTSTYNKFNWIIARNLQTPQLPLDINELEGCSSKASAGWSLHAGRPFTSRKSSAVAAAAFFTARYKQTQFRWVYYLMLELRYYSSRDGSSNIEAEAIRQGSRNTFQGVKTEAVKSIPKKRQGPL